MTVTLEKEDILNLICGTTGVIELDGIPLRESSFFKFKGNQWNEDWEWDREFLSNLDERMLWNFYQLLKIEKQKA